MTDYEIGSAAWDIGQVLTLHSSQMAGSPTTCARVLNLQQTTRRGRGAESRLEEALATDCTCGRGNPEAERTSLRPKMAHE